MVTVVLDLMAMGMVVPALPRLLQQLLDGDTARAAEVFGAFGATWALMQFLASPLQGVLSDRFGRRPLILLSNLGLGVDYVLMATAPTLGLLLLGRVLSGISAASISTSTAYIADVSSPEQRARRFGLISIAFGIGFTLGPAIGGMLATIGLRVPFWTAAALSLLNAAYGFAVLPESLPIDRRAPFAWRRASPIGSLGLLRSAPGLLGLAAVNLLSFLARQVLPSVFVLYGGYRYSFGERAIGFTLAGVGVSSAIVGGLLVQPAIRWLGERRTLLLGLLAGAVGFAAFGLAWNGALFWAAIPVMALWGVCPPTLQSLMSQRIAPTAQGQLQGASASLIGLAGLVGPGLFAAIFAGSIRGGGLDASGMPFLVAAVMMVIALAAAERVTRPGRLEPLVPETSP